MLLPYITVNYSQLGFLSSFNLGYIKLILKLDESRITYKKVVNCLTYFDELKQCKNSNNVLIMYYLRKILLIHSTVIVTTLTLWSGQRGFILLDCLCARQN